MAVAAMIVKTGGEICLDRCALFGWVVSMKDNMLIGATCTACKS